MALIEGGVIMAMNFLISLFLGMLPEVLYITLMTSNLEGIKTKRVWLFMLNSFGYIVLIMLCRFELLFYIAYIIYLYWVLKVFFKVQITSFFMISTVFSSIIWVSFICSFYPNYCIGYIISRIMLLVLYLFRHKFSVLYYKYKSCWNRGPSHKIKSITLRNCSLVFINAMIIVLNVFLMMCSIYLMNV